MTPRTSALVLAALATGVWSGCNSILGIEEAHDGFVPGTGAAGGSAGASGSAGSGAAAGATTGGSAGAGGSGGSGGNGGSGGTTDGGAGSAGTGGSAGACGDPMTDQKNCGWCGHDCGSAACIGGYCKPEELNTIPWSYDFVLTADSVFVSGGLDDTFYKMPKTGAGLQTWTGSDDIYSLSLHAGFVYFIEYNTHAIWRASTSGTLAPSKFSTANSTIGGLLADQTGVYYHEEGVHVVRRVPLSGTGATDFVTNIYNVWYMAADATDLYLGAVNDGIFRVAKNATPPLDGGTLAYFYDIPGDGPAALALDQDAVYFSTGDPSGTFPVTSASIIRISKDKSSQKTLGSASTLVYGLAVDATDIYWTEEGVLQNDFTDGFVRGTKLNDSAAQVRTYATQQRHPIAVKVDGEWIYWLNGGWTNLPGGVRRVRR
jgi:hypothetical protein